jgi:hypothetical protein
MGLMTTSYAQIIKQKYKQSKLPAQISNELELDIINYLYSCGFWNTLFIACLITRWCYCCIELTFFYYKNNIQRMYSCTFQWKYGREFQGTFAEHIKSWWTGEDGASNQHAIHIRKGNILSMVHWNTVR